jgi:hypothetical protein
MSIITEDLVRNLAYDTNALPEVVTDKTLVDFAKAVEKYVIEAYKGTPALYNVSAEDIERAFKMAVRFLGIPLLDDMTGPAEDRPEGQLNAVTRALYNPGDHVEGGAYTNDIAPPFYEQFSLQFAKYRPKYVAFKEVYTVRTYNPQTGFTETRFRIRYATIV